MTSEAEIRSTDSSSPPDPEPSDIQQLAAMKKNGKVPVNVIVQQYEKYRKSLKETGLLAFKGEGTSALIDNLKELEELYTSVHKSSSMSVHFSDAQALSDTSNYAAVNAKNLKLGDLGVTLNVKEFNNELAEYLIDDTMEATAKRHSNGEVSEESFNSHNWLKLGLLFHKVSSKPIPMEFLNGPIDTEKKVRTKRRIIDDTKGLKNTTTAQQLEVDELENDELNTAHLVKSVFISFNERQKTNPEPVNFFKFFIDPASFSQSVENLFFTSFLIRDARIKLEVRGGIPVVSMVSREETRKVMKNDDHQFISNHHIASFDYETWQELIKTHNITESYLGHRDIEADQFDQNFDDNFSSDDDEDDDDDDDDDDAAGVDDEEDDIEQDLLLANGDLSDISQTAKHNDEDDESQNNQLQELVSESDEDADEAIIEPSRKRRRIRN